MAFKKGFDKALKIIPTVSEDLLKVAWKCMKIARSSKQKPEITGNLYTYLFPILLQNKQKPITKSCRNNLWSKPILILSKTEFKVLRKKPGDEAFRVAFKFLRHG